MADLAQVFARICSFAFQKLSLEVWFLVEKVPGLIFEKFENGR